MTEPRETRESRMKIIEETLKEIQKDLKNPKNIIDAITNVEKEIRSVKQVLNEIQEDQKILKAKQEKQEQEIRSMQAENRIIRTELTDLREYMEAQEREKRKNWMELTGIPEVNGENLSDIINNVHDACGLQVINNDIIEIYRKKSRNTSAPIILKYAKTDIRDSVKKAMRTNKVKASDIGFAALDKPIYANDCLSKRIANLFWRVRREKIDKKWHSCWTARNKIYVKINQTDDPVNIRNEEDLITLIK